MYLHEEQLLCAFFGTLLLSSTAWSGRTGRLPIRGTTVTGGRSGGLPIRGTTIEIDEEAILEQLERQKNLSTNDHEDDEALSQASKVLDPQGSWLSFVRHSDRIDSERKAAKKGKGKQKNNRKLKVLPGPRGPEGPQGPPGPPGPPGGRLTKEEILKEFGDLVRETAEKRAEIILAQRCPGCSLAGNNTIPESLQFVPRVSSAFRCQLGTIGVAKSTLLELKNFEIPFDRRGSFSRSGSFDPHEGRYTAPRSGVYQFSVNIHIRHKPVAYQPQLKNRQHRPLLRKDDKFKVMICMNSSCRKYPTLEHISGFESNSRTFTISLTGLLEMEAGDYTSIFIQNRSSRIFAVYKGSDFSGMLVNT